MKAFPNTLRFSSPVVQAIFVAMVAYFSQIAVLLAMYKLPNDLGWMMTRQFLALVVTFGLPPLVLLRARGETADSAWRVKPNTDWKMWMAALFTLPLFIPLAEWMIGEMQAIENVPQWMAEQRENNLNEAFFDSIINGSVLTSTLGFIMIVMVGPIVEEFFFRGTFQRMFTAVMPGWAAIALTSLFFAGAHSNVDQLPAIFSMSLLLGYLYYRTQSLWTSIIAHMAFNGVNYFIELGWIEMDGSALWTAIATPLGLIALLSASRRDATPVLIIESEEESEG